MNTGLILVDIQNDYFADGRMELVGMDAAAEKASRLLTYFRENQMPTFHIQHISTREGATFFLSDTRGVEFHASIKPAPDDLVIRKHFPNSFRETTLLDALKSAQVDSVVICGAMSHMCIDATTRAAADLGFRCTLIHDACATRNLDFGTKKVLAEDVHASFMAALNAAYARVISCNDFISQNFASK
ncbi:MAG: cysteine hydrolase family protein [Desulfobacterales bacterium]|jgi:nicotinamidase-related amidase